VDGLKFEDVLWKSEASSGAGKRCDVGSVREAVAFMRTCVAVEVERAAGAGVGDGGKGCGFGDYRAQ
jgi:hypothetical protein